MSAAIRAQRERRAAPRSIAPDPAAEPEPERDPEPEQVAEPEQKNLFRRRRDK